MAETPTQPPARRRSACRRERMLDAAACMFADRGYHGCDVQVLADELGIGKGSIYRQFPTKEALFLAAVDRGMRRLHAQIEEARLAVADPLEQLLRGTVAYLAFFDAHPEFVELFILERAEFKDRKKPTYHEHREVNIIRWQEAYRALMADGRLRTMPTERVANVISDLLYGTMFTNRFAGRRQSFERQAWEILDIVFLGILTETERARRPLACARAAEETQT
ncbi:MAG TPA: helix-turn-helix domain-containing protein [Phycisphaerae bacterium]|nr:helix-turn-helix domain-containing protein [Phycisphaerae bacterium]